MIKKNNLLYLSLMVLAGSLVQCELVPSTGEYCPGNENSNYADDAYDKYKSDANIVSVSGECPANFPHCVNDSVCTQCPEPQIYVSRDGSSNKECLTCDQIKSCKSESCQTARIEKCWKIECTDDGLITKDGVCQCNTKKHWVEDGNQCVCQSGYMKDGAKCVLSPVCPAHEVYISKESRCVCDSDNHWVNDGDTCVCDSDNHWVNDGDTCVCKEGYEQEGSKCVSANGCANNEVYDETQSQCVCNEAKNWVMGEDGCQCIPGFAVDSENKSRCIQAALHEDGPAQTCSNAHEIYDTTKKICVCDEANHWVETDGNCSCDDDYVEIDGSCVEQAVCDKTGEEYDSQNNTCKCIDDNKIYDKEQKKCICDVTQHWTENGDGCACTVGYVEINKNCVEKAVCDKSGEEYNPEKNTCNCTNAHEKYDENQKICVCDESGYWVGTTGNCKCKEGYSEKNGICQTGPNCDEKTETYNSSKGVCECKFGYKTEGAHCVVYEPGDSFTFGSYHYEKSGASKSIKWIVLSRSFNEYFLLSEKGLDNLPFNADTDNDSWRNSSIKKWLNDDFYHDAFSSDDKKYIVKSSTDSESATDYVILLSRTEAKKYLLGEYQCQVTPYTLSQGATVRDEWGIKITNGNCSGKCYGWWWLRNPGPTSTGGRADCVLATGDLCDDGEYTHYDATIRPAIRIQY